MSPSEQEAMALRLRKLRIASGLQQSEVARQLDVSAAYLSLIEKGKRTIQLPLLCQALELYGTSMEAFMESIGKRDVGDGLRRLLDEPLLRSLHLNEQDLQNLGEEPKTVATIATLFNLYKNTRSQLDRMLQAQALRDADESVDTLLRFDHTPFDEVRDFLHLRRNWFPSLEKRAEEFREETKLPLRAHSEALIEAIVSELHIEVHRVDREVGGTIIRAWDPSSQRLQISTNMFEQRLRFQLAQFIALRLFERENLHQALLDSYESHHEETPGLIKVHLANYFAGALLLPYSGFYEAVIATRYDVELLAKAFESSYETVAHRICNLGDPERSGLPMHFARIDVAGNISKRYAADGYRFAEHYGSCPKAAMHVAFLTPTVITKQYETMPDGSTFFTFAKVVTEPQIGSLAKGTAYCLALGTRVEDAEDLAYADEQPFVKQLESRLAVPIGPTCRFCERTNCNLRSAPSYKFAFQVDEDVKKDNFFSPILYADRVTDSVK